ncbi:hypothetical protein EJB05_29278, partial [Eragrostis curvula]
MSQALFSRARLLLLPYARSAHPGHALGLRSLSSHGAAAAAVPYGEHQRQRDEEGKAVKVTVWWDFQKCLLPSGANAFRLGARITAALRSVGIRGPVEINAFGDVTLFTRDEQEALAATGITFSHVPKSDKESCDRLFMADLIYWIAQNPPPAHFFLISGDKEFANVLHRLRMSNYNILLAHPNPGSKELCSAATIMWKWGALVKGVNVTPTYVNQPPDADGVSYSWYGSYRSAVDIQLLKSKDNMALPRNTKVPRVPKPVFEAIKKVLQFYPEGISLPNLRAELTRINVSMDRGLFGFTKFSALLQAMPDVVKFIEPLPGDSQPAVVGVFERSVKSSEQDLDGMDSAQSIIDEKHISETESEEQSSWDDQSSSSELSSFAEKKTPEADAPSSPSDQSSSSQRKAPDVSLSSDVTIQARPRSNRVEADVSLSSDVPSSDTVSRDQLNAPAVDQIVTQTEPRVSRTEADMVASPDTSSEVQGNLGKKGLFERILSLWNGPAH